MKCLKPLLSWAKLVLQLWGNKITFEDSLLSFKDMFKKLTSANKSQSDMLIKEGCEEIIKAKVGQITQQARDKIIDKIDDLIDTREDFFAQSLIEVVGEEFKLEEEDLNIMQQQFKEKVVKINSEGQSQYVLNKFEEFRSAWNTFRGVGIMDGCDEIVIQPIEVTSCFQYCCITNTKRDSLGYHFFMLLQWIALSQNTFLVALTGKGANESENQVELMKLTGKQIIQSEVSQEKVEEIIKDYNSFNCLKYGEGTQIMYDLDSIFDEL